MFDNFKKNFDLVAYKDQKITNIAPHLQGRAVTKHGRSFEHR